MEMKNAILPIGLLVVLLIILGVATLMLTGTVNDKVTKLADMNSIATTLANERALLITENLDVKTNYNNLLTNYNTNKAELTAAQSQVTSLSGTNTTLTAEKATLMATNATLLFDNNRLLVDNTAVTQLRLDKNALIVDKNKLVFDYNILSIDRNILFSTSNDYNTRAHRLYNYANPCYLAVKCIDNNAYCATKYGYDLNTGLGVAQYTLQVLTLKTNCVTAIDANVGDYNYFS